GGSDLTVGLLTAIPYGAGAVAMVVAGRHSDRTGERRWHVVIAALVGAAGLAASTLSTGVAWSLATSTMGGVGAAASIALVNSVGNTGGFVGPYLLGALNEATGSFVVGLRVIALMLGAGAAIVLAVRDGS